MKKSALFCLIVVFLFLVFLCGGSGFCHAQKIVINVDGTTTEWIVREKFFLRAKVALLYGGDYGEYCEKECSGDPEECFGRINGDFHEDMVALCDRLDRSPVEPFVTFDEAGFSYIAGNDGVAVEREKFFSDALSSLTDERVVRVSFRAVKPKNTIEDLKKKTVPIASFSTDYSSSAPGRKKNVALACRRLNGVTVPAGETLSFNKTVGERTTENGFFTAKIIVDGEFVDGVGGGVCQVSTTLFDAWLRAGLAVDRAAAHSLPVSYVPPSFDAMVSSSSDLSLRNDSSDPVYLRVRADGKKIVAELFGAPKKYDVRLRSVTERILPATYDTVREEVDWRDDERERVVKTARDGLIGAAYRDYYDGDALIRTEFLRRNVYKPQNGKKVVRDGTEAKEE